MVVVLMGVSGSGKTTIGEELAAELGWAFVEADDFHPAANVEKMAGGTALPLQRGFRFQSRTYAAVSCGIASPARCGAGGSG